MPDLVQQTLLWCVLAPGVIAAAVVLAAGPWQGPASARRVAYALGPAVGLAYVIGQAGLVGAFSLQPLDATMWLWHVAAVGAVAGVVIAAAGPTAKWPYAVSAALCAVAAWLPLRLVAHLWPGGAFYGWLAVVAAGLFVGQVALSRALADVHPGAGAGALVAWAAGVAGCVAASGSVVIGQRGGIAAAAAGGVMVAGIVFPRAFGARSGDGDDAGGAGGGSVLRPAIAPAVMVTGSVIAIGYVFASVSVSSLALLSAVPVAVWAARAIGSRLHRPRLTAALVVATALSLSGVAALSAALGKDDPAPATSGDDADYGYGYD